MGAFQRAQRTKLDNHLHKLTVSHQPVQQVSDDASQGHTPPIGPSEKEGWTTGLRLQPSPLHHRIIRPPPPCILDAHGSQRSGHAHPPPRYSRAPLPSARPLGTKSSAEAKHCLYSLARSGSMIRSGRRLSRVGCNEQHPDPSEGTVAPAATESPCPFPTFRLFRIPCSRDGMVTPNPHVRQETQRDTGTTISSTLRRVGECVRKQRPVASLRWPATDTAALSLAGSPTPCSRASVARTFLLDTARRAQRWCHAVPCACT